MDLRRTAPIGISISVAALLIYVLVLDVKPSDITSIGLKAFFIASLFALARLLVQGVRFYLIAKNVAAAGHNIKASRSILVRVASEFVTLVTPSYVGGEAVRIAWLNRQGVKMGQAVWVAYLEVLFDVVAGTSISILAAILAIGTGAHLIGGVVLLISCVVLGFYLMLTALSIKRKVKLPEILMKLLRLMSKGRADALEDVVRRTTEAYGEAASKFFGARPILAIGAVAVPTIIIVILAGTIFWFIGSSAGVKVDLFFSILAVYVAITVGTIPIVPGGSGLSELGMSLFTSAALGGISWSSVVAWRLVSYHVPLAICGAALVSTVYKELKL